MRRDGSRRVFLLRLAASAGVLGAARAGAQANRLNESDPQAVALGYRHDTARADAKKYPRHTPTQRCSNCALYQGKGGEPWGGCPLFAGRQVAAGGWCSAWAPRKG